MKTLNKATLRRLERTKSKLSILGFDEVNVLREVDSMYSYMEKDARRIYRKLYVDRYAEMYLPLTGKKKLTDREIDVIEEMSEMYVDKLLSEPNESTHYTFTLETIRKRDRAKESILSRKIKIQKQMALQAAIRFWAQQAGFYVDFVSQAAEVQAMKDAGVKRVQRHERNDDKVCSVCKKADGEIYDIDKIPPLTHLRCRRWFTPVLK